MKKILALLLIMLPASATAFSVTVEPNIISDKDFHCLTQNVYFEARNQSLQGQHAVVHVTMNRVISKRFPNTVCGVVWESKQFSWTHDGKPDRPGKTHLEQKAWKQAQKVAREAFEQWALGNDPTNFAMFYHADYVKPYWASSFQRTVKIDKHIFYK